MSRWVAINATRDARTAGPGWPSRRPKHNTHLVPQHKFVYRGNKQNVTAVLRYESLDEGLPKPFAAHKLPFERNPRFRNKPTL